MKKSLIALAALAATGAYAQSSATIYGRMDLGYSNTTTKAPVVSAVDGSAITEKTSASSFGMNNGRTTSRLGVTGVEDLGGGLKAAFNYEVGLAIDNIGHKVGTGDKALDESARVGFGGTRLANLSLSGGFGTVTLGTFLNSFDALRGYSAATFNMPGGDFVPRHVANQADTGSAGATFVDSTHNIVAKLLAAGGEAALSAAVDAVNGIGINGRSANSVAYRSPSIAGFTLSVGLVNDKTKTSPNQKADSRSVSGTSFAVNYAAGPISAMAVYGSAKNSDMDAATTGKATDYGFAASYNAGVAIPYVMYERVSASNSAALFEGVKLGGSALEIGARFPMGALTPYVSWGTGSYKVSGLGESIKSKNGAMQFGALYDISKRTYVYAAYGNDKQDVVDLTVKRSGMTAGLVHQF